MNDHVKNVCKLGQWKECCRYLIMGGGGFDCAKHTSVAALLDKRVADEEMHARGDNCEGKSQAELNS